MEEGHREIADKLLQVQPLAVVMNLAALIANRDEPVQHAYLATKRPQEDDLERSNNAKRPGLNDYLGPTRSRCGRRRPKPEVGQVGDFVQNAQTNQGGEDEKLVANVARRQTFKVIAHGRGSVHRLRRIEVNV